jgi:serine/threonine-protein kinase
MKDAPIPDHIGRYQILERVGQGGMGVLYRGFDPKLDREVAIKVILTDFSEDAEQLRPRFYREAKATARLQHRNIVTVFEFAEDQNQPHIVMEFLRGIPLAKRMTSSPPLTLDDKLDVVAQLCAGLGYAHSQGVIHRDVKPANMFLLEDGTVKLLDFGIAKLATSTLTKQGDVLGSPSYMSPEQVAGSDSVDGRADVWSTGVVLYELLAGRKPFEGETPTNVIVKILKEEPKPIESIVPTLPKQLVSAVHRALQKDPGKRIAKADELGRELQWIRKALQASGELAPMEETKFASTQVLKALHEDLQQQKTGTISAKTLAGVAVVDPPATAPKKWVLPAGLAAVVVAGVAGWALLGGTMGSRGSTAKPVEAPAGATTPAPPPEQKPGEASMLAANSNPGPPPSASVPSGSTAPASVPPASAPFASAARATPPAPSTPRPAAAATKEAPPPATEPKPAAPPVMVEVTMTSPVYAFEVLDGNRAISPPGREHTLAQPNGKTLRVVAGDVLLDQQVRVDGDADKRFEWAAPALGRLDIRARRENCKVLIGKRDFGNPPLVIPVVVGDYAVVLSCPDGQNPSKPATVSPGRASQVLFTEQ